MKTIWVTPKQSNGNSNVTTGNTNTTTGAIGGNTGGNTGGNPGTGGKPDLKWLVCKTSGYGNLVFLWKTQGICSAR